MLNETCGACVHWNNECCDENRKEKITCDTNACDYFESQAEAETDINTGDESFDDYSDHEDGEFPDDDE